MKGRSAKLKRLAKAATWLEIAELFRPGIAARLAEKDVAERDIEVLVYIVEREMVSRERQLTVVLREIREELALVSHMKQVIFATLKEMAEREGEITAAIKEANKVLDDRGEADLPPGRSRIWKWGPLKYAHEAGQIRNAHWYRSH